MNHKSHDATGAVPGVANSQTIRAAIATVLVTVAVIAGLVYFAVSQSPAEGESNPANLPEAVALRLQKVGTVVVRDASSSAARSGEEVFKGSCTACHSAGLLGAPKFGDAAAWAPRIATGYGALLNSALKGKNAMTAQGGGAFSDIEVGRAVVYMANAGGAKFAEPAAPAAKK